MSSTNETCCVCLNKVQNDILFGEMMTLNEINAHYFCLLSATFIEQTGRMQGEPEGILGFTKDDIASSLQSYRSTLCYLCRRESAAVKCAEKGCERSWHYPCGTVSGSCVTEFTGQFKSYCGKHFKDPNNGKKHQDNAYCLICFDVITSYDPANSIISSCCLYASDYFRCFNHKQCVLKYTKNAGNDSMCINCIMDLPEYDYKLTKEQWQEEMRKKGIFIPMTKATWEQGNYFVDQVKQKLQRHIIGRSFSSLSEAPAVNEDKKCRSRMSGWQIHSYSDNIGELQYSEKLKKPVVRKPTELLIKVLASSVNPIDVAMMNGYGSTLLNTMRCDSSDIEFPLTLGRDFVGEIIHKGLEIKSSDYKVGEKVWGVVPVHHQGCHCEYVAIDSSYVSKKPENLNDIDASAVLYAGLTAWSGLFVTGQLNGLIGGLCSDGGGGNGKKVLVIGASGGVGSLAVQMLQVEGVEVGATCGTDAISILHNLGIQKVIDYTEQECDQLLIQESPYDIILDCAGKGSEYAKALPWSFNSYITFKSPLLKNFDSHGIIGGGFRNVSDLISSNITGNGGVKWGYFWPAQTGIQYLKKLAEKQKLLPIIDSTFSYDNLPAAYQKVQDGHLRGKVVIDFNKN
ncbi:CLUMA_CG007264, isoform A [Clunio marinus]|uniref:CLUMA_CG007264, isoform A n=1 Tax=Clunio marinus TaxID=568069 RepID=A0A1J1I065_9DIPT|nr:CLUMA_CG007264, isoform A [Clunio marinus]